MTYDWAKPGVKVVCIKTWINKYTHLRDIVGPVEGQFLTIRDVLHSEFVDIGARDSLRFEQIRNPILTVRGGVDRAQSFAIQCYKPLVTKSLPQSLTCLLKNPKSVILPN